LSEEAPGLLEIILLNNNTGTTYSRNLALKMAKGDFICIVDSDVILLERTIDYLVNVLKSDDKIGLVVPRLIYGDGRLQKSVDDFPTIITKLYRVFFLKLQEQVANSREKTDTAHSVDYAISAFWLFRHSLLDRVGLLDEQIFYAPEDVDYCLRIWKAGLRVVYDPFVTAIHNAQEISRTLRVNRAMVEHIKGLAYYFKKHKYCVKKPVFPKNSALGTSRA
jgi:GT2 family glycosyltransferase